MKKNLILLFLAFTFVCNSTFAELSFDSILKDKSSVNFEQKLKEVSKIDYRDKYDLLNKDVRVYSWEGPINYQVTMLYILPKEALLDNLSLSNFIERIDSDKFYFEQKRIANGNFNIYYERNLLHNVDDFSTPEKKEEAKLQYAEYDNFYKKLSDGKFNFNNPDDRKQFVKLSKILYWSDSFNDTKQIDENNEKIMKLYEYYFSNIDFTKKPIMRHACHKYRLGYLILENYNEYSADFIERKLKDKNTDFENLCYFLQLVTFDKPIPKEIEKEFDDGIYSVKYNPLYQNLNLSQITGEKNKAYQYIQSKGIILEPLDRLRLISFNYGDEYVAQKIVDSVIASENIPNNQKGYVITCLIKKFAEFRVEKIRELMMENVFSYMVNGMDDDTEKRINKTVRTEWNKSLKEYLKNYPDVK